MISNSPWIPEFQIKLAICHAQGKDNLTLYRGPPDAEMNSSGERGKANANNGIEFSGGITVKNSLTTSAGARIIMSEPYEAEG